MLYLMPQTDRLGMGPHTRVSHFGRVHGLEGEHGKEDIVRSS